MIKLLKTLLIILLVFTVSKSFSQKKLNNSIYSILIKAHSNAANIDITSADLQNVMISNGYFSKKNSVNAFVLTTKSSRR